MKKIVILSLLIAAVTLSCDDKPDPEEQQPQPHESTITAFDRDINVIGDASISAANFNTAKAKLEAAVLEMDAGVTGPGARAKIIAMLNIPNFAMIIETGDTAPDANANKSLTVGVNYLLSNDVTTIGGAIFAKIINDGFTD